MNIEIFLDLVKLGLKPIPIIWDAETKTADSHQVAHGLLTDESWDETTMTQWADKIDRANGMALKLFPPFGMLDFDTKNQDDKDKPHFKEWLSIIEATNPDALRKVCIEVTRNNGFHVYIKYSGLSHKIGLAASTTNNETIAVYTGGVLSYCSPTPGYEFIHNSFDDIDELTADEYDLFVSTAALFNKSESEQKGEFTPIQYPEQYELHCLSLDANITDEAFERMLNDMTLYEVRDFRYGRKPKFTAYLRKGSTAKYSAKVYFGSRKVLLFTSSLGIYPSWQDAKSSGDKSWVLTPSRIIYYRNGRNWAAAMDEIQMMIDSLGIELPTINVAEPKQQRTDFPYDIFPDAIRQYIESHKIQNEYIAGFMLSAISTAIGNTAYLQPIQSFTVKSNLYMAIVAYAGGGKSPAMKIAYRFIQDYDNKAYERYRDRLANYNEELNLWEKEKKKGEKPKKPVLSQIIANDATMEMMIHILQHNPKGCCLVADELAGFMKRMSQYKDGDDGQKWLEMWDSSPVLQQRISADERKIFDYTIGIVGGIQPMVIQAMTKGDNQHNGFYHRFLFIYPEAEQKPSFEPIDCPTSVVNQVQVIFDLLLTYRENDIKDKYILSEKALRLYQRWFDFKNEYYNRSKDDNIKGIIAKYQSYCLRFALILQCLDDLNFRRCEVSESTIEKAIRLTEYFFGHMLKALSLLAPESPIEQMKPLHQELYNKLPKFFSTRTAIKIGSEIRMKESAVKVFINRNKELFRQVSTGEYEKLY